jgi:hypothetical protein
VWSRSLDYEFHHKGDGHIFYAVPVQGMKEGDWFRAVCHFHHMHPGSAGPSQVEHPSVGVYPDHDTFYRVGLPMVNEVRREALVAFEEGDADDRPQTKRMKTQ